jgi:hypothetical protein
MFCGDRGRAKLLDLVVGSDVRGCGAKAAPVRVRVSTTRFIGGDPKADWTFELVTKARS